jgi:hypothetical protein
MNVCLHSEIVKGRAPVVARARELRWRGRESHGEEQSVGEGSTRGEI